MASSIPVHNVRQQQPTSINLVLKRHMRGGRFDPWEIDRVDIKSPKINQQIRFNFEARAKEQCLPEFWCFVADYLPTDQNELVLSAQDAAFVSKRFVALGLHITGQRETGGVQRVVVSLRKTFGPISEILHEVVEKDSQSALATEMSLKALNDIVLPMLNVAAAGPLPSMNRAEGALKAFVDKLQEDRCEVEMYAALLSRYIAYQEKSLNTFSADTFQRNSFAAE